MTAIVDPAPVRRQALAEPVPPLHELAPVRSLDHPFATGSSPITVATPSCCCCCCCCVVTLAGTISYTATVGSIQSQKAKVPAGQAALGGFLSVVSLPLALLIGWLALRVTYEPVVIFSLMGLTLLVAFGSAMALLGEAPRAAFGRATIATFAVAVALVAEFFLALATLLILELFFPLGIYIGHRLGKGAESDGDLPVGAARWDDLLPPGSGLPDADRTEPEEAP